MNRTLELLVGLFGAMFTAGGAVAMLAPRVLGTRFAVDIEAIVGLSTLRGVLGGLLVGSGVMMLIGLRRRETAWFRATAVVVAAAALGRLLSLVLDGPTPATLLPFCVEMSAVTLMLAANHRLRAMHSSGS